MFLKLVLHDQRKQRKRDVVLFPFAPKVTKDLALQVNSTIKYASEDIFGKIKTINRVVI